MRVSRRLRPKGGRGTGQLVQTDLDGIPTVGHRYEPVLGGGHGSRLEARGEGNDEWWGPVDVCM